VIREKLKTRQMTLPGFFGLEKLPNFLPPSLFLDTIRKDSHHKMFKNSIHVTSLVFLLLSGGGGE
jgi:hypothetical protein